MKQSNNDMKQFIIKELDLRYLPTINESVEIIKQKGINTVREINRETNILNSIAYHFKLERFDIEKRRKYYYN